MEDIVDLVKIDVMSILKVVLSTSYAPDNTHVCMLSDFSRVRLCVTPWTIAHQAPLPMEFSRQWYWSGLPCPPPGDLPNPENEMMFPAASALQADSLPLSHR